MSTMWRYQLAYLAPTMMLFSYQSALVSASSSPESAGHTSSKKADFSAFNALLSKAPWERCFLSKPVDDCWICLKDILFSIADQCIPKITLCPRRSKHWLSNI